MYVPMIGFLKYILSKIVVGKESSTRDGTIETSICWYIDSISFVNGII